MKAIVCTKYGAPDVLKLKEVEKPVPKDNEVLIRVHATAVNSADWRMRKPSPFAVRFFFGFTKPRQPILGGVIAGEIESVGKGVKLFNVGDKVFGTCGMRFGAYAEYVCLPEKGALALKPNHITFDEAASVPFGGTTARHFLEKATIQSGQKVLIYGASGAVGTAAVQLAKYLGADVTGVCGSSNVDMVRELGADQVIDYTQEDFTKNGVTYDVIFDTVGKSSFSPSVNSLKRNGVYILGSSGMAQTVQGIWTSITSRRNVISGVAVVKVEDIRFLKDLLESGELKPVIDRSYPLENISEAHRYVEKGHKKGNVVIILKNDHNA